MNINTAAIYFFIYCPLGIIGPLISQYLSSIGFSGTQVGIITSAGTGTAILAGLLWGRIYANTTKKRIVLMLICFGAAFFSVVSTTTTVFTLYIAIYCGIYFFHGPLHGLADAFVLEQGKSFSGIRAMGAVGYATAVFVAGRYAEYYGLKNIFYMYAIAFVIGGLLFLREKEPNVHKASGEKIKMGELFRNKDFVKLLICSFFFMGTSVAHNTYFGYLFRAEGGTIAGIGLAFLLMAGSEAPFMALTPILSKKLGAEKVILVSMIIAVARFAFYSTGPSYWLLLGSFFLQGMTNGIILVELVKYFSRVVEPKMAGLAMAVYYAIGSSLSAILCNLIGGMVLDWKGPCGVYAFFALYNGLAVVLYISMKLYKPHKQKI